MNAKEQNNQSDTAVASTENKDSSSDDVASSPALAATAPSGEVEGGKEIGKEEVVMSKKKRRRLMKKEKMLERKRQKKEERHAKALAEGRDIQAEQRLQAERTAQGGRQRRQRELWQTVKLPLAQTTFQIAIDCSFDAQMTEREIASLGKQLQYCYAYNKKAEVPCRVGVTSIQEGDRLLSQLQKEVGFKEWSHRLFTFTPKSLEAHYESEKAKIVYLTSDSTNIINQLEDDKIYVVGGIVDRNRLKRIAIDRAETLGIATAKLPLDAHLAQMSSTPVLACNHVFNILLKTRQYQNDWSKALEEILPSRKDPRFKNPTIGPKQPTHSDCVAEEDKEKEHDNDDDGGGNSKSSSAPSDIATASVIAKR